MLPQTEREVLLLDPFTLINSYVVFNDLRGIRHTHSNRKNRSFQLNYRRLCTRLRSSRQNSYRREVITVLSLGSTSLISEAGGATASAISFSPCTTNHSPSIASARASTHSFSTSKSSLRRFADELSFAETNDLSDAREHSSKYSNGGGSESSDTATLPLRSRPMYQFIK